MTVESAQDFHEHVEFYRKFVRKGAMLVGVVALVLAMMAIILSAAIARGYRLSTAGARFEAQRADVVETPVQLNIPAVELDGVQPLLATRRAPHDRCG